MGLPRATASRKSVLITFSRSTSKSYSLVSGRPSSPIATIYTSVPLDSAKFGSTVGLGGWKIPSSESAELEIYSCHLGVFIGAFPFNAFVAS